MYQGACRLRNPPYPQGAASTPLATQQPKLLAAEAQELPAPAPGVVYIATALRSIKSLNGPRSLVNASASSTATFNFAPVGEEMARTVAARGARFRRASSVGW